MAITVLLADDNLIVREGVRALVELETDLQVVGTAAAYDEVISAADDLRPHVVVTDIRMPPRFENEGIEAAHHIRRAHPGTGVVILSQYDSPDYAIALLRGGADGYAYLLKDRVAEGGQLATAIRQVAIGRSWLDSKIVAALVNPFKAEPGLTAEDEDLLGELAAGRTVNAIAAARNLPAAVVSTEIDRLFATLGQLAGAGAHGAVRQLRMLHDAIVDREQLQQSLSRLIPRGVADRLRRGDASVAPEIVEATIVMSDVRGYSAIAEQADVTALAGQLGEHRAALNTAIVAAGGTVMGSAGDSVMGVFGALIPQDDHAARAVAAAREMHSAQGALNRCWQMDGLPPFEIGVGVSTGKVAAAMLGSSDLLEYSVVGDCVNLTHRLQQWAKPGETVISEATYEATAEVIDACVIGPRTVKGRRTPVTAYRVLGDSLPGGNAAEG